VSAWKRQKLKPNFGAKKNNEMNAFKIILKLTLKKQRRRTWSVFFSRRTETSEVLYQHGNEDAGSVKGEQLASVAALCPLLFIQHMRSQYCGVKLCKKSLNVIASHSLSSL
jgi:hypothetical protein